MDKRINTILRITIYSLLITIFLSQATDAQEEGKGKDKKEGQVTSITTKMVSGKVGVIRPNFITIIYQEERKEDGTIADWEMVIPIDEKVKLSHIKTIDALKEGDTIEINYEESSWVDEEGVGRSEKKAKQIRFISPAPTGLRSGT